MAKICPVRAGRECVQNRCAWFFEYGGSSVADPWGECALLKIALDLHDVTAHDADDLGLLHVRIQRGRFRYLDGYQGDDQDGDPDDYAADDALTESADLV